MFCNKSSVRLCALLATVLTLTAVLPVSSSAAEPPDGPYDAGPDTPPIDEFDQPPDDEVIDVVDPVLPPPEEEVVIEEGPGLGESTEADPTSTDLGRTEREEGEDITEPELATGSANGDPPVSASPASGVGNVALARTGYPALAVGSLGGLSLLTALGLFAFRRRSV